MFREGVKNTIKGVFKVPNSIDAIEGAVLSSLYEDSLDMIEKIMEVEELLAIIIDESEIDIENITLAEFIEYCADKKTAEVNYLSEGSKNTF